MSAKTIQAPTLTSAIKVEILSGNNNTIKLSIGNKYVHQWCVNELYKYYDSDSYTSFLNIMRIKKDKNNMYFNQIKYPFDTYSFSINKLFFNEEYTIHNFVDWIEHTCNNLFFNKNEKILSPESRTYKLNGKVFREVFPFGTIYEYDTEENLVRELLSNGSMIVYDNEVIIEYNSEGNIIKKYLPDGSMYEYDNKGRVIKEVAKDGLVNIWLCRARK